MAEEKKTSTKADAKSEKTAKAAKSSIFNKKFAIGEVLYYYITKSMIRQRAKRLFGHLQRTSLKTPLLFLL